MSFKATGGRDKPRELAANAPAGGTGATGGAYDTAGNRDLMIATVNALNATVADIIRVLRDQGILE